jgi:hypothetical protein
MIKRAKFYPNSFSSLLMCSAISSKDASFFWMFVPWSDKSILQEEADNNNVRLREQVVVGNTRGDFKLGQNSNNVLRLRSWIVMKYSND